MGSTIVTGDSNVVATHYRAARLPPAESVDMGAELQALRKLLTGLHTADRPTIGRALDDADDELAKPAPEKDEVGKALERAVKYAKGANDFAAHAAKLAPHIMAACAWLGSKWHALLAAVETGS
jgi:hypothetical protein